MGIDDYLSLRSVYQEIVTLRERYEELIGLVADLGKPSSPRRRGRHAAPKGSRAHLEVVPATTGPLAAFWPE